MNHSIQFALALVAVSTAVAIGAEKSQPRAARKSATLANMTNTLNVTGMHCQGCAGGLSSELQRTPGVASASVSLTNRLAVVAYDTNRIQLSGLMKVVQEAGFKAALRP